MSDSSSSSSTGITIIDDNATISTSCNYSTTPCDFVDKGWSDGGVFSVLELNLVGAVIIFLIYSFLQSRESNRALYQPRAQEDNPCSEKALPSYKTDHIARCAPKVEGWFAWALSSMKNVSDEEILVRSGLEAMLFVRFQRTIVILLFKVALLCGAVLIPVNSTGDQNLALARVLPGKSYSSGFNDWMVTNLADNDTKLWAHCVVFVITTLLLYQAFDRMMTDLSDQRILYLKYKVGAPSVKKKKDKDDGEHKDKNHEMTHTVLLSGLPMELRDAEALADHIDTYLYPEALVEPGGVLLIYHKPQWRQLLTEEAALQKELIHHRNVLKKLEADNKPLVRPLKRLRLCGDKVDAIHHCEAELKRIRDELTKEDGKETHPTTGYAFVNFKSEVIAKAMVQNTYFKTGPTTIEAPAGRLYSAGASGLTDKLLNLDKVAAGGLQRGGSLLVPGAMAGQLGLEKPQPIPMLPASHWQARRSPPPDDIIWDNLYMNSRTRTVRYILFTAATWFLILFSAIPIGFLGSLSSLASIPLIGSAFEALQSLPAMLLDAITAYLPVIVLILFQVFLPDLMCYFAKGEGLITRSDVEAKSLTSLFTFFFFSTLLTSIIAGGTQKIVDIVDAIAGDPFGQIMALLVAITSPESGLFCALLLQGAGIGCALLLLRIGPYFGRRVKLQLAVTEDEVAEANLIEKLVFFTDYPTMLLNLTISLFFSLTLPITTVFGWLFFCVKYFITRHNVAYVYSNGLESGGKLYASAIRILIVIQAAFQLATVGMFGGKLATAQFGIALAFFLYTLIQYPGLNRRLNAVFLQDDWIPDIDLTPDEKADRVRRKQQKEAKEKQRRIEEILREKSLLDGDEMVVVMSKSERQAAGHLRQKSSGGAPQSARNDASLAHAALFHHSGHGHGQGHGAHDGDDDTKREGQFVAIGMSHGDGDAPLHGDQLGNIDMDAATALGIQMTSPRHERMALTTRHQPPRTSPLRTNNNSNVAPSPDHTTTTIVPDAATKGSKPTDTFVTIDIQRSMTYHDGATLSTNASSSGVPGAIGSPSITKRRKKKIIKKKSPSSTTKKRIGSPDHTGLAAVPRQGEDVIVGAEMSQLARANSGIPIDSRARAKVATSTTPKSRHRSPSSANRRRRLDDGNGNGGNPASLDDRKGSTNDRSDDDNNSDDDKDSERNKKKSAPRSRTRCECGPIHIDSQYER